MDDKQLSVCTFFQSIFLLKMQEIEVVMKEKIGYNLFSVFYATAIWKTGYKEEVK